MQNIFSFQNDIALFLQIRICLIVSAVNVNQIISFVPVYFDFVRYQRIQSSASPSGILEHPGVIKDPKRVREAWHNAYGSGNSHKVAVLEEGMKYQPISIPNNEAQFLETRILLA